MSTVVHDGMVARTVERETMTIDELRLLAERTAQELLGMSAEEAFRRLDDGEFSGQAVESTLRGIKRLLDS